MNPPAALSLNSSDLMQSDDFALFQLPKQFTLDPLELQERWRSLQKMAHPDRFSMQGDAAKRLSMQWSTRINEAYQRLKDPLRRAAYLCHLYGVEINAQTNTAMPEAFLMEQLTWREALEEARSAEDFEVILQWVQSQIELIEQSVSTLLESEPHPDAQKASAQVRAWMFLERFEQSVQERRESRLLPPTH
jgi:molecular chaperone HscB